MVTKIAVVIPTIFNRPEYLPIAYKSLANQQGDFTLEIIVGCPAALVEKVKQVIPGAKVTAEPSEGGLGQKLGQLLASAAAESDFVAWLGDDDLLTTDSLKHSSNEMLKDKQVVMVYGGCDYIDASGKVQEWRLGQENSQIRPTAHSPAWLFDAKPFISGSRRRH